MLTVKEDCYNFAINFIGKTASVFISSKATLYITGYGSSKAAAKMLTTTSHLDDQLTFLTTKVIAKNKRVCRFCNRK